MSDIETNDNINIPNIFKHTITKKLTLLLFHVSTLVNETVHIMLKIQMLHFIL